MDCKEERVDMRNHTVESIKKMQETNKLVFQLNHTMPISEEYSDLLHKIFGNIGEGSFVSAPIQGTCFDKVEIGNNVFVNSNCLFMSRGGITIKDNVQIASNCQLLSNNHDFYDRQILTCKPVVIEEGAWIGAGATIMPGIRIGKNAIVGACSVVTHDVPDCVVVVGSPAKVIKTLDKDKFKTE